MKKVYIRLISGTPHIPLLYPNLGRPAQEGRMGFLNNTFDNLTEPSVEVVDDPAAADFILIPHNFAGIQKEKQYLQHSAALSQKYGKRIVVFWHGDSDAEVDLPNVIVFRTSQYRSSKRDNEIIMPAYAPDLLGDGELQLRSKGEQPVVGFCGWARYKNFKNRVGTMMKRVVSGQWSVVSARTKGITLRMKALKVLRQSDLVQTNFLLRSSYSGSAHTIRIDPEKGREEYIQNMLASDFPLVIKGDGNYSYRFYEALSLGRVPVLLDTECVLPLENVIDYDECVLRIPLKDLSVIDQRISAFGDALDAEQYASMQRKAREVFEKYLNTKSFLKYAVEHLI